MLQIDFAGGGGGVGGGGVFSKPCLLPFLVAFEGKIILWPLTSVSHILTVSNYQFVAILFLRSWPSCFFAVVCK